MRDIVVNSNKILTLGNEYHHPKGGIAQVLYLYSNIYQPYNFISIYDEGSNIKKIWTIVVSTIKLIMLCLFRWKIQIVHIHTASYTCFTRTMIPFYVAILFGKKTVLHIHGGGFKEYYKTKPDWILSKLQKADAIVVLSDEWYEFFAGELGLKAVYVVRNMVERPVVEKFNRDMSVLDILFFGVVTETKGVFDLVEVIGKNKDAWKGKVKLHIGGNGKVDKLNQMVAEYDIADMVIYEGFVSGDKKTRLLSECNTFALPSYIEGLPMCILEAMAYEMPIISSAVGAIPGVVNENGILIEPGNQQQLEDAINKLLSDVNLREKMAEISAKKVQSYFPENIVVELNNMYQTILD